MLRLRKFVAPLAVLIVLIPLLQAMPALAFKPYTHNSTGDQAWIDVTADGKVTIEGRDYNVDPRVVSALQNYRSFYNAGVVGPDGFPDLTYGQSIIHPENTGEWLRYIYTEAWKAQSDAFYTAAEKQQILAFAYGYLTHAAGDMWAHTLVNQFATGVFPAVGDVLTDVDMAEIAIRHIILEGYIGDATAGFDGNPDRGSAPFGDVSDDSTPGVPFDAPHRFIYRTLIDPNAPTPSDERGPIIGFFLDLRGTLDAAVASEPQPLQDAIDAYDDTKESLEGVEEDCNFEDLADAAHDAIFCIPALLELGFDVFIDSAEAFANFVAGTLASLADVVFDAYLNAWIADIDTGLQHWSELGLASTRALFDPQAYRNTQNDDCQFEGSETSQNRINCEDGIGQLDVLLHEADPFINDYLLSMLGAPDAVGGLRQLLQDFSDDLAALGVPFNPIQEVLADIKEFATEMIKDLIEEAYGIDVDQLKSFLTSPTHWLNVESVSLTLPGAGNVSLDLFQSDDHERLDAILGLDGAHHVPVNIPGIGPSSRLADDAEFVPDDFAPYKNVVTTAKLLLLGGTELNRVLGDLLAAEGRIADPNLVATYPAVDANGFATNVMIQPLSGSPWLTSIDSDHAWRADGLPIFCDQGSPACGAFPGISPIQRPAAHNGGNGQFPIWESCLLRPAFRGLYDDWENGAEQFPDLGDLPSADSSDPAAPVSSLGVSGEVTTDGGGTTYIAQHHTFTLTALDQVFTAGQLGLQYRYYPDGGTPGAWTTAADGETFALPADALDGVWHIDFRAEDPCHTFSEADSLAPESTQTFTVVLDSYPEVAVPVVIAAPSDEAQEVTVTATFSHPGDPDQHTCEINYGDSPTAQPGIVTGTTCTGTHTYADDNPTGTSSDSYTVTVTVTDDDGDARFNTVDQTVNNVTPTIVDIPTNAPVPQGQLAQITVNATDPGAAGDPLTYAFDCDNDGVYEVGSQTENNARCALDPAAAFSTIGVQVSDDDLGVTVGSVEIKQTLKMCANVYNGAMSQAAANGACPAGSLVQVLPKATPAALCISLYTGQMKWQASGHCASGHRPHVVPDDGPLHYCRSMLTGQLRIPRIAGQCITNELPGVVPGVIRP